MDDLISRKMAIDALWEEREALEAYMEECLKKECFASRAYAKTERNRIEEDIYILEHLPSAQKKGEWIEQVDLYGFFDTIPGCSECGHTTKMRERYNYCPNCGADMRGDSDGRSD